MYDDPLVPDGKWGLLYAAPGGGLYDPTQPRDSAGLRIGDRSRGLESQGGLRTGFDSGLQEVGGLPIAGVKSLCTDKPFRHYKDMTEYGMMMFSVFDMQRNRGAQPGTQQGIGGAPRQPGQRQTGDRFGGRGGRFGEQQSPGGQGGRRSGSGRRNNRD
jgi:hypothetical protein